MSSDYLDSRIIPVLEGKAKTENPSSKLASEISHIGELRGLLRGHASNEVGSEEYS